MIEGLVFATSGLVRTKRNNCSEESLTKLCTLDAMVIKLAGFNTSEPRDIVYSLLSLAQDGDNIQPDYGKQVHEVFEEVVEHVVRMTLKLELICRPWARLCSSLPSWVNVRLGEPVRPSTSSCSRNFQLFEQYLLHINDAAGYATCKHVDAETSFYSVENHRILRASGLQATTIYALTTSASPQFTRDLSWQVEREEWQELATRGKKDGESNDFFRVITAGNFMLETGVQGDLKAAEKELQRCWAGGGQFQNWIKPLCERINSVCAYRRLMRTSTGLLGLVPQKAQAGDLICVLFGCSLPLVLRPQDGRYIIIGECYVDGLMEGQAITEMEEGKLQKMDFDIQ
jgi:hypothetical protein